MSEKYYFLIFLIVDINYPAILYVISPRPKKSFMLKACLLAFLSGIFFFFLILQSAWWLLPGVLTWTAIFVWQDHQEHQRDQGHKIPERSESPGDPNKQNRP